MDETTLQNRRDLLAAMQLQRQHRLKCEAHIKTLGKKKAHQMAGETIRRLESKSTLNRIESDDLTEARLLLKMSQ